MEVSIAYIFARLHIERHYSTTPLKHAGSKMSTIIHELSHFSDLADTDDMEGGYNRATQLSMLAFDCVLSFILYFSSQETQEENAKRIDSEGNAQVQSTTSR